jgi:hypothetical protein
MIPKLCAACYVYRFVYFVHQQQNYFTYFRHVMKYGIIVVCNSSYCKTVFTRQKKILKIMVGEVPRNSC